MEYEVLGDEADDAGLATYTPPRTDIFYRAEIIGFTRISPSDFQKNFKGPVFAIEYLLYDTQRKEYRSAAEGMPLSKKEGSRFLQILSAVTGKRITAANITGRNFDLDKLVGKQFALKYTVDVKGRHSILLRQDVTKEKHIVFDRSQYVQPTWITRSIYTAPLEAVDGDVSALLDQTPSKQLETLPEEQPETTSEDQPRNTYTDLSAMDIIIDEEVEEEKTPSNTTKPPLFNNEGNLEKEEGSKVEPQKRKGRPKKDTTPPVTTTTTTISDDVFDVDLILAQEI